MADTIKPDQRSENMRRIKSKDTSPEMTVRRLVHRLGYRYRLHRKDLPGKPDLTFASKKRIIFVHGCFWHQHNNAGCKISRMPKSHKEYWVTKLKRNVERDSQHQKALTDAGWRCLVIWECETKNLIELKCKLSEFLCGAPD